MRQVLRVFAFLSVLSFLISWVGLGLLYHRGLSYLPEPERPRGPVATPILARALWVGIGESGEISLARSGPLRRVVGTFAVARRAKDAEPGSPNRFRGEPGQVATQTCLKSQLQSGEVLFNHNQISLGILSRSIWMSRKWTADEVLGCLAERLYFGRGLFGIEAAAEHYFGVSSAELTEEQAALLAVISVAPSYYDPERHPQRALAKRDQILKEMRAIPSP